MKNPSCEKLMWAITRGTIQNFLAKEFPEDRGLKKDGKESAKNRS